VREDAKAYGESVTEAMKRFAKENSIGVGTLYKKIKAYESEGPQALIDLRGRTHGLRMPEWQQELVEARYLDPTRPSVTEVWEMLAEECQARAESPASYSAVKRLVRKIPDALIAYHRMGKRAWSDRYEPTITRSYDDLRFNEIQCMDSRRLDLFVYPGKERGVGKPIRPWFTLSQDAASRKILGWAAGQSNDSTLVGLASREGIRSQGIPDQLYIDNGSEYDNQQLTGGKKRKSQRPRRSDSKPIATDSHFGVWGALGIEIRNAIPFNARGKFVESLYSAMSKRFEHNYPGWCGRDNKQRPEKLDGEIERGELLTWPEFVVAIEQFIEWWNNHNHGELGCSPNARAEQLKADPAYAAKFPSDRALDLFLRKQQTKDTRVTSKGVTVLGVSYWSDELIDRISERLAVYYDPRDMSEVQIYDLEQMAFVCTAKIDAKIGWNPTEREMKAAQRRKTKARKAVAAAGDEVSIANDNVAALQAIVAERGQAPEDTSGSDADPPDEQNNVLQLTALDRLPEEPPKPETPPPAADEPQPEPETPATAESVRDWIRKSREGNMAEVAS